MVIRNHNVTSRQQTISLRSEITNKEPNMANPLQDALNAKLKAKSATTAGAAPKASTVNTSSLKKNSDSGLAA